MAQFSHSDFGGMSQWSPGMTMVGDMFNNALKTKLDAVCTELAAYVVAETPSASRGRNREAVEASYRSKPSDWWPAGLGTPSAVGGQNVLRYAVFPRRLAINDNGRVQIYDTGSHRLRHRPSTEHRPNADFYQPRWPRSGK